MLPSCLSNAIKFSMSILGFLVIQLYQQKETFKTIASVLVLILVT